MPFTDADVCLHNKRGIFNFQQTVGACCSYACTAKKFEAARKEFKVNGVPNVDYVLTTQELVRMIKESG